MAMKLQDGDLTPVQLLKMYICYCGFRDKSMARSVAWSTESQSLK